MPQLLDSGIASVIDTDSSLGVGWKLNFYTTGTSSRKNTYPTEADADALINANANPVVLSSDGRLPPVWLLDDADYKLVITDENDVVKETIDPANGPRLAGASGAGEIGYSAGGTGAVTLTLKQIVDLDFLIPEMFGAVGDATTNDVTALNNMVTRSVATGRPIYLPGKIYAISTDWNVTNGVKLITGPGTIKIINESTTTAASVMLKGSGTPVTGCTIRGIKIDANGKFTRGIEGQNCVDCHILDNRIFNLTYSNCYGIFIKSHDILTGEANGNIIRGNRIEMTAGASGDTGRIGIVVQGDYSNPLGASNQLYGGYSSPNNEYDAKRILNGIGSNALPAAFITDNIIEGNHVDGGYYSLLLANGSQRNVVQGNFFKNNMRGIVLEVHCAGNTIGPNGIYEFIGTAALEAFSSHDNLFEGNHGTSSIADNDSEAILSSYVGCYQTTFDGNTFKVTSATGTSYAFYAAIDCEGITFQNNEFYGPVYRAACAAESGWDTLATNAAHKAYGATGVAEAQLEGLEGKPTKNILFKDNVIELTNAKPAFFLGQINQDLQLVAMIDNDIRGTAYSDVLVVMETVPLDSVDHTWVGNRHLGAAADFTVLYAQFREFSDATLMRRYHGSATSDVGSISAGLTGTVAITVTGAVAGDHIVSITASTALDAGLSLTAFVSGANTVTAVIANNTAGAVDPASKTYRAIVEKRYW